MYIRKFPFPVLAIITLLLVACSSGTGDTEPLAQDVSFKPADSAVSTDSTASQETVASTGPTSSQQIRATSEATSTSEISATPEPTVVPASEPTPVPEAVMSDEQKALTSLANIDMEAVVNEVMGSQELMGCLTDLIGLPALMSLSGSEPTQEQGNSFGTTGGA